MNISEDERETRLPTKERVPEVLASSTYGCFFQAYFKAEEKLNQCFNENGEKDHKQWKGCLDHHAKYIQHSLFVNEENEYYKSLRTNQALKEMMALDPYKYLKDMGGNAYHVNIDLLKEDSSAFIDSHFEI